MASQAGVLPQGGDVRARPCTAVRIALAAVVQPVCLAIMSTGPALGAALPTAAVPVFPGPLTCGFQQRVQPLPVAGATCMRLGIEV